MSFAAQGWAWAQTLPAPQKMVLLGLADCHNGETGQCNPSMKYLAFKCGISRRGVIRHLATLEEALLILVVHKYREDGSMTSNGYQLNIAEHAKLARGGDTHSPRGGDTQTLRRDTQAHLEPGIEPGTPEPAPSDDFAAAQSSEGGDISQIWPTWYATLYAIPGFKTSLVHATKFVADRNISDDRAEDTAFALKSKWPGPPKNPYKDPWATFQNWVKKPPLGGGVNGIPERHPQEDSDGWETARAAEAAHRKWVAEHGDPTAPKLQ